MGIDGDKAIDWIRTTVTSFTPPGDPTLNIQDDKGQGGVDSSFLAGLKLWIEVLNFSQGDVG